jgi:hypothetical protein
MISRLSVGRIPGGPYKLGPKKGGLRKTAAGRQGPELAKLTTILKRKDIKKAQQPRWEAF